MALLPSQLTGLQALTDLVGKKPESFAQGSEDIRLAALDAAKFLFDLSVLSEKGSRPHVNQLLVSLEPSTAPQTRSQSIANGKRKRTPNPPPPRPGLNSTPINTLFIEGMNDEQIWSQLDLRAKHICETLEQVLEGGAEGELEDEMEMGSSESEDEDFDRDEDLNKLLKAMANGNEDVDLPEEFMDGSFSDEDAFSDGSGEEEESVNDEDEDSELEEYSMQDLRDPSSDDDTELSSPPLAAKRKPRKAKRGKHSVLDDGFFDLAAFNAETEQAEARSSSRGQLGGEEDDEDDEPVDLFATVDAEDVLEDSENPGEAMYADFFAPPPKAAFTKPHLKMSNPSASKVRFHEEVRVKNIKPSGKNLPLSTLDNDEDEDSDDGSEASEEDDNEDEDEDEDEEDEGDENEEETNNSGVLRQHGKEVLDSLDDSEGSVGDADDDRWETMERLKDDLFADEPEATNEHGKSLKRNIVLQI
ncbi:hypothetical protein H0H92_012679 [Tricholoma furcatifolium]|nr:hypothetical protein H0H92_012679 [Tricholoma furcatifolium]